MPYSGSDKQMQGIRSDRAPKERWTEVCDIVQQAVIKTITKKKKWKKAKWLSEAVLQIAEKRREVKGKEEKERYIHSNSEFQRIARRDKKAFQSEQCKKIEGKKRMGKTNLFQENQSYQGNISCKDQHNKRQKRYGPNRSRGY